MKKSLFLYIFLLMTLHLSAQFAPPAGMPGTTAMYRDSSAFTGWASSCSIIRGYVNISDTNFIYWVNPQLGSNKAFYGHDNDATGKADDTLVVSLGDGGVATLAFPGTIYNGPGDDFAVFENALNDSFLELAFVEVSSDGINFFRFPCTSLTQTTTQVPTFGTIDAEKINNLAGKYRYGFGTPFDLDTLKNTPGLDVDHISHVRVVDAVGCIQSQYATHDALGNIVNELWPTPFNTCGFDLDAVGVIHLHPQGTGEKQEAFELSVYPNPASDVIIIKKFNNNGFDLKCYSEQGSELFSAKDIHSTFVKDISLLGQGIYFVRVTSEGKTVTKKFVKL